MSTKPVLTKRGPYRALPVLTDSDLQPTVEDQDVTLRQLARGSYRAFSGMMLHDETDAQMALDWRTMREKGHSWASMAKADYEALETL